MIQQIPIAEQFYSVQGEGPYAGTPAVFLRLAGCNLSCGLTESQVSEFEKGQDPEEGADWICDTIDVWRQADRKPTPKDLVDEWDEKGWLEKFEKGAHLVITGGEPMLPPNQSAIRSLVSEMLARDVNPLTEVETNGTIEPNEDITPYIDQWNVSMKLSNSGMAEDRRVNPEAINYFEAVHDMDEGRADAVFKFVVSHGGDPNEIVELQAEYDIPDSMMMLMPAGQTTEDLRETYPVAAEIAKVKGWRFSPRLQVDIWGEVTGV